MNEQAWLFYVIPMIMCAARVCAYCRSTGWRSWNACHRKWRHRRSSSSPTDATWATYRNWSNRLMSGTYEVATRPPFAHAAIWRMSWSRVFYRASITTPHLSFNESLSHKVAILFNRHWFVGCLPRDCTKCVTQFQMAFSNRLHRSLCSDNDSLSLAWDISTTRR